MDDVLMSAPLFAALDIEAAAALKASMDERRMLKRLWMWRRDRGPGIDPVALDAAELGRGA